MCIIGVDIGGTSIRIGQVDAEMCLTGFRTVPQADVLAGDSVAALAGFIQRYIDSAGIAGTIEALAVGVPATMNRERTTILSAPNVHGLDGQNLHAALAEAFPFPVFLDKDVAMLYAYDGYKHAIPKAGVVIACYIGTGLGNVIAVDGKILTGSHGVAGELGHIPAMDGDVVCGCGNIGCAETLVGGKRLQVLRNELFPQTEIAKLFAIHAAHPAMTDFIRRLAATIAAEINIVDPHTVVLGGGVVSMDGFPKETLEQQIRYYARKPFPERGLRFLYADNAGENGVIGAGILAWERLKKEAR